MLKKKWFRALLRQRVLIIFLLALQAALFVLFLCDATITSNIFQAFLKILSMLVCIYIVSTNDRGTNKLLWVFLILMFPIFGGITYIFFSFQLTTKTLRKKICEKEKKATPLLLSTSDAQRDAEISFPERVSEIKYLCNNNFPIYKSNGAKFLTPGEEKLKVLLEELEKAEKYIFMEYFIIKEGIMWDSILEVLKRKAKEGVKVRILYDDLGCFMLLPKNYPKQMEAFGIECKVFNRFSPFFSAIQNNRDHRKIVSIDGKIAFTGGVNLSDEYINSWVRHGHWKDTAIAMYGDEAMSFTLMFLQMWEIATGTDEDYSQYLPEKSKAEIHDGYIQPYSDNPIDTENVSENVYLQIINNAKDYVWINTPYLIIDDSMISALSLAAKSGVDVRITTPHIGDRRFVHKTTRSYYADLIQAGVKIYEYTNGYNHAKTFVSDDEVATVGTVNLDYRSLYTHFECGALLFGCEAIKDIKADYIKTMEISEEITLDTCKKNKFNSFISKILRVFAPLL